MTTLTLSDQATDLVKAGVALERRVLEANHRQYRVKLSVFERRYRMTTKRFLSRFNAGRLTDGQTWFDWLFAHRAHTELSKRLAILRGVKL